MTPSHSPSMGVSRRTGMSGASSLAAEVRVVFADMPDVDASSPAGLFSLQVLASMAQSAGREGWRCDTSCGHPGASGPPRPSVRVVSVEAEPLGVVAVRARTRARVRVPALVRAEVRAHVDPPADFRRAPASGAGLDSNAGLESNAGLDSRGAFHSHPGWDCPDRGLLALLRLLVLHSGHIPFPPRVGLPRWLPW